MIMEKVYLLEHKNLIPWLESMGEGSGVYIPATDTKNGIVDFFRLSEISGELGEGKRYKLNLAEKTRLSPKHVIYPQWEDLLDFSYGKDPENIEDVKIKLTPKNGEDSSVIFGLKPCDAAAISRMDKVFGQGIVGDPYYLKKRENTLLVSLGCDIVFEDCFCTQVGGSPFGFDVSDLGLMKADGGFAVFVLTEKGGKAVKEAKDYFEPVDEKEAQVYRAKLKERERQTAERIASLWPDTEDMPGTFDKSFSPKQWKKLSEKCISCGACTFTCPTCYCFDIRDEKDNQQGQRYRTWDYCTSYLYTLEASGHNPREDISKRYRNKVNCKYNYNLRRHGQLFCVGCGRCIEICPVDMDIRKIVAEVIEDKDK